MINQKKSLIDVVVLWLIIIALMAGGMFMVVDFITPEVSLLNKIQTDMEIYRL